MSTKEKACDVLLKLRPTWITCAIVASGISVGLAVMWNPKRCTFKAYKSCASIILSRYCIGSGTSFRLCIFNIYVPYNNKKAFWDRIDGCGILDNQHIIVAGDLNLIMEARDCWVQKVRMDPLADYFKDLFNRKLLMGIVVAGSCQMSRALFPSQPGIVLGETTSHIIPNPFCPTWRNECFGEEGIAKRLDRFLVHSSLLVRMENLEASTFYSEASDHDAILLQWRGATNINSLPIKFDHSLINDTDFREMVQLSWNQPILSNNIMQMERISLKLKRLKQKVRAWISMRKEEQIKDLCEIEKDIATYKDPSNSELFSQHFKKVVMGLVQRKNKVLKAQEEWRLKSKVAWIKGGDKNTRFFHMAMSKQKAANSIWHIRNEEGRVLTSLKDIKEEAFRYFKKQYKESKEDNIFGKNGDGNLISSCFQ
eukprot:PITA_06323